MKIIDEELFRMWGGGIDYALSSDFKDLSDDEKDALYERYKVNLAKQAKQAINAYILGEVMELIGEDDPITEYTDECCNQLRVEIRKELGL